MAIVMTGTIAHFRGSTSIRTIAISIAASTAGCITEPLIPPPNLATLSNQRSFELMAFACAFQGELRALAPGVPIEAPVIGPAR
jgi:hypothetical protein